MLNRKLGLATLGLTSVALLAACGNSSQNTTTSSNSGNSSKFSIVFVTDSGGVDDKSFNQSAWEAFQKWGEETGRSKNKEGYNYIQSSGEADYATNFRKAVSEKYDLIYAVGFGLAEAVNKAASENPDSHFVAVDASISEEHQNGATILFAEQEAAYLAGVAAARTTKTNHVGFIGGVRNETLIHFEAGFIAGVKSVDPNIQISSQWVGSFQDSPTGNTLANTMYESGADVIYAAAGTSGLGVFSSAISKMQADSSRQLWVIGVDRDQEEEGQYKDANGETQSVTLASTLKQVGNAMVAFAKETEANGFKTGTKTYTLSDDGVDLTEGHLSSDVLAAVKEAKQKIINGEITPPKTDAELEAFLNK